MNKTGAPTELVALFFYKKGRFTQNVNLPVFSYYLKLFLVTTTPILPTGL